MIRRHTNWPAALLGLAMIVEPGMASANMLGGVSRDSSSQQVMFEEASGTPRDVSTTMDGNPEGVASTMGGNPEGIIGAGIGG